MIATGNSLERTPRLRPLMADSRFPLCIFCPWNIHWNPDDLLFRKCLFCFGNYYKNVVSFPVNDLSTDHLNQTDSKFDRKHLWNKSCISNLTLTHCRSGTLTLLSTHRRVGAVQQTQHQQHEPPPLVHFKKQQPLQLRVRYPRNINVRRHRPNLGRGGREGFSTFLH